MTRWNEHEPAGSGGFLFGLLAGALVGAGVALLMAPKSGAAVRRDLNSGMNTMRDAAERRYREMTDRLAATYREDAQAAATQATGGFQS
jgi:gas vesicle protein